MKHLFSFFILVLLLFSCEDKKTTEAQANTNDFSEVIISGTITNRPANDTINTLDIYVSDLLADETFKIEKTAIDSNGNFKKVLLINKPQTISISHKAVNFNLIVEPNKSINIAFKDHYNTKNAVFNDAQLNGSLKNVNSQLFNFQAKRALNLRSYFDKTRNLEPDEFKIYFDSIFGADSKYIDNYAAENRLEKSLEDWLFVEKHYLPIDKLLVFPMYYEMFHPDKSKNVTYEENFFEDLETLPPLKSSHLINNSINSLGNYLRFHYYDKLNPDKAAINAKTLDSLVIRKMNEDYKNNPLFAQLAVFDLISSAFDENNLDFLNSESEFIEDFFKKSIFKPTIERRHEATLALLENPELPKNALILDFNYPDGESFVKDVVKNASGKIVYIDNWAVWCAPCRSEFKEATPKLKEQLSDKVEFVYICHKSDEKLWRPMIAQYQLEGKHYFVSKEQSKFLSEYLNITGFPNYNIIGQNNTILYHGFEYRPSQPETIKILAKLTE